jgi:hypothetical protein
MVPATPPILVFSDDLCTFRSVEAMLAYIEPIDEGDVHAVFDSEGRRFVLRTEGVKTKGRWVGGGRIWAEDDNSSGDIDELDEMLRRELSTRYREFGFTNESVASMDHAALVGAAERLASCE